jgi:2-amino-4-hydroxy-6-hydroxymethyldihydropteridine diphosphokinase
MPTDVFVALGSNLGDSRALLNLALKAIQSLPSTSDLKASSLYLSKALSSIPQPDFLNAVCSFKTTLEPLELLTALQEIELKLGKVAKPKEAPRLIDLDILFFGDLEMRTERLEIPHPRWMERLFVLCPLSELLGTAQEVFKDLFPDQKIEVCG